MNFSSAIQQSPINARALSCLPMDPQETTHCVLSICTVTQRWKAAKEQNMLRSLSTEETGSNDASYLIMYIFIFEHTQNVIFPVIPHINTHAHAGKAMLPP